MDVVRVMVVFCIQTSGCGGGRRYVEHQVGRPVRRTPGSCALIGGFSKSRKAAQRTRDQGQDSGERERSKFQGLRRSLRNGLRSYVILVSCLCALRLAPYRLWPLFASVYLTNRTNIKVMPPFNASKTKVRTYQAKLRKNRALMLP